MIKHREITVHKAAPEVKVEVKVEIRAIAILIANLRIPTTEAEVAIPTANLRIPVNGKRKHKG